MANGFEPVGPGASGPPTGDHEQQVRAAETRLLYDNAHTGTIVSVVIASVLAYAHWGTIAHAVVLAWLLYMLVIAGGRSLLALRYRRASQEGEAARWNRLFVAGAALAALGWGGGAFVLNPASQPANEILLVFAVGGVMLGGAALLAARPEAFLAFLLPAGLLTALRLAVEGDRTHLMMAFLGGLFTAATVVTTWRFHMVIASSIRLRFENRDLIEHLRSAKDEAEALNRQLELRVRDRTARLTEADQRKDEFLATLAHELRNPLAPIRFALDVLKADAPPATTTRALDIMERQIGQLVRLVDDLLDVSRITANKIQLRREPLDMARLMTIAAESIAPLAAAAGHAFHVEPPTRPVIVDGDGARLVQVFTNILQNAVKFTPAAGQIWFTAEAQDEQVLVRIRDTGVGIAPEVLPHVFEMFHQAEPILERTNGGLGIGLTLARRLVEMQDGRVDIQSPGVGQGTEVQIRLPILVAATAATAAASAPPERPAAAARRGLRVLIVEDNLDAAAMLDVAVARLGHETCCAHDGATALTVAAQFVPDVIFLDIGLPVIDGYTVAQRLRERPEMAHVHIAALTGWGQDEDRRKAREAGCDHHLTKPLAPAALGELLARIAEQPQARPGEAGVPRTRRSDAGWAT